MDLAVRRAESDAPTAVTVWIDTAFNGFLVFPQEMITKLALQPEAATEAILADGSRVTLESFALAFGESECANAPGLPEPL